MPARIAYLTNVYPKVSHSFIQTEIAALERAGVEITRFTIRRAPGKPSDAEACVELERTIPLLGGNMRGLLVGVVRRFWRRPGGTLAALVQALAGPGAGHGGASRLIRACAYFAEAALLADELERRQLRHLHVHFGTNPVSVARLACRMATISYSFTAHGPDEFDAPLGLDLAGKIADAAFVVGVSSFGRGQLMRWSHPKDWPRIHLVRCAVAPIYLAGPMAAKYPRRFVCVARLSAQKGLPLLLQAVAALPASADFSLDIIGDGEQRRSLEEQIERLGLLGRVNLLGWRSPAEVVREIALARALILPSFAEGLPVVLMEALALGRAVIATAVAGIPELVDEETGWLIPAGSVEALTLALLRALDASPEQLRAMGAAGQARVRSLHDPDANARALAALLLPCLRAGSALSARLRAEVVPQL
ncbi:glycosyltransferase [Sphingomonas sp.]|uniref:glycosyltransferase n=1 Tax=Sphingomonas sp. TaxID=28214 RepID=UPI0025E4B506|nr:glycosyltransferase [Sphingomonas sp.]